MNLHVNENTLSYVGLAEEKNSNIAIYGFFFVILVTLGRIQEIIPGLERLYLGKVSFGLALVLVFFSSVRNRVPLFSVPQLRYLFWLLAIGIVSTPFGLWPKQSLKFLVYQFGILLLLTVLLVKIVVTYRDLVKVIWSSMIAITILAVAAVVLTKEGRASASETYDPNDLAFNIVCFLPLIYFLMKNQKMSGKIISLAAMAVSFIAMLMTMSRSGFVGFMVIVLFALIREKVGLAKIVVRVAAIAACIFFFSPQGYTDRMGSILDTQGEYNYVARGGRLSIWKGGVITMLKNPLLGTGPDTFVIAEGLSHEGLGKWSTAHNSFIQIGTEFGIMGLVLFVKIIVTSLKAMVRCRTELPEDSPLRSLATGVEVALVGYIASGSLLSQAYSGAFYILIGLAMAISNLVPSHSVVEPAGAAGKVFMPK